MLQGITQASDQTGLFELNDNKSMPTYYPIPSKRYDDLSRLHLVSSFVWSGDDVVGTQKFLGTPWSYLQTVPSIARTTSLYAGMRCKWKLRVSVNATTMHYGRLLIAGLPCYYPSTSTSRENGPLRTLESASACPNVILSARTNQPQEIVLSGHCTYTYMDISYANPAGDFSGCFAIYVLTPLMQTSEGTPTLRVSLHMAMEDVELFAPRTPVSPPAENLAIPVFQADKPTFPVKYMSGFPIIEYAQGLNEEQTAKDSQGTISSFLNTVGDVASFLTGIPIIGSIASVASPIAKVGASIAKKFGHDMPLSRESGERVIVDPFRDFPYGSGLRHMDRMTLIPDRFRNTDVSTVDDHGDPSDICRIVNTPGLIHVSSFSAAASAGTIVHNMTVGPAYMADHTGFFTCPPVTWLAMHHTHWRGGMKYKLLFSASNFLSCRLRVIYLPHSATAPTLGTAGELHSWIIDVTGDTEFNFTVPYTSGQPWQDTLYTDSESLYNRLIMMVENPVASSDTDASSTIYFAMFASGAEDFQLSGYRGVPPNVNLYTGGFVEEAQGSITEEFKNSFQPTVPGSVSFYDKNTFHDDPSPNVLTCLHRKELTGNVSIYNIGHDTMEQPWTATTSNIYQLRTSFSPQYTLGRMFRFQRHSTRVSIYIRKAGVGTVFKAFVVEPGLVPLLNAGTNSVALFYLANSPCATAVYDGTLCRLEFEMPMFRPCVNMCEYQDSPTGAVSNWAPALYVVALWPNPISEAYTPIYDTYMSWGDDSVLGCQQGPPFFTISSSSSSLSSRPANVVRLPEDGFVSL